MLVLTKICKFTKDKLKKGQILNHYQYIDIFIPNVSFWPYKSK